MRVGKTSLITQSFRNVKLKRVKKKKKKVLHNSDMQNNGKYIANSILPSPTLCVRV